MRKILILMLFMCFFLQFSCATNENFYLNIRIPPEKLIPNTINAVIYANESANFSVDLIPKFADDSKITWECIPSVCDLSYKGKKCKLTAKQKGDVKLIARDEGGAFCEIKIKVHPQKTKISIEGEEDTIKIGEQAIFIAHTEPESSVKWQVDCGEIARASYGGAKCRISAKSAGIVKISAIAENGEKAVKTLAIAPPDEMNISLFGTVLGVCAVLCLTLAVVFYLKFRVKR